MWSMRRALVVLVAVGFLAVLAFQQGPLATGQQEGKVKAGVRPVGPGTTTPPSDPKSKEFTSAITLPTDSRLKKKIEKAEDEISNKDWENAAITLQQLLDIREDVFIQVPRKGANGIETNGYISVRKEAERLIAVMPTEGRAHYQLKSGQSAKEYLDDAKSKGDPELLATVYRRFLYTEAGFEATELLGTYNLDRSLYQSAAICFDRLLQREPADKLPALTLFKAALAFQLVGDTAQADIVRKHLPTKVNGGMRLGNRNVSMADLEDMLDKKAPPPSLSVYDWKMYQGGPNRTAQGIGSTAFMERKWFQPTIRSEGDEHNHKPNTTWAYIKQVVNALEGKKQALLPQFHPVAATVRMNRKGEEVTVPLVLFRSFWGVHAVDLKTGKLEWETQSDWSFDRMLKDNDGQERKATNLQQWISAYIGSNPHMLVENSIVGTLSTDNTFVYVIEDLALPPSNTYDPNTGRYPQYTNYGTKTAEAIACSKLQAFNLQSGKLIWSLGGKGEKAGELADSYFLGPPLPMGGKVYVLTEKGQELILVCLNPTKDIVKGESAIAWKQTLASTKNKMQQDVGRRMQAAHLSYSDGILVCPTNAGAVLGVDLLSHGLVWAYEYQNKGGAQPPNPNDGGFGKGGGLRQPVQIGPDGRPIYQMLPMPNDWKVTAPVIAEGKVVFTAPDAKSVHCINVRDGSFAWEAAKGEDDLYLAGVFNGKALVVGKKYCKALSLADGKVAWTVETGMPSGQGIASENIYYLPLKNTPRANEPEICAIDMNKGEITAHTKSRKKADGKMEVPGNLLFYEGDVLSQTVNEVTAYPQLKIILAETDKRIKENPKDPEGLAMRGELRLDKGDLEGAIADLQASLDNKPKEEGVARIRFKLFESITELLQRDFDAAERLKLLDQYEQLCKADGDKEEEQRRMANRLCLLAKGREKQGKLLEAFQHYQDFGALAAGRELISVIDEPTVKTPPDVWAQGRIAGMVAKATDPKVREPLEKKITEKWQEVKKTGDLAELRKFVSVFGSLFDVGREARMHLAERLGDNADKANFLEAELHLQRVRSQSDNPQMAGRAVEALARLMTRKGLMDDAAYYYRVLGRDFAKVAIRDGKTGEDLLNELATDKRFLPYLDEPNSAWMGRKYEGKQENFVNNGQQQQIYNFEPDGEMLPFFQRHRVALNINYHQLNIIDRKTNEMKWSQNLTRTNFQNYLYSYNPNGTYNNLPPYPYKMTGHLVVLQLVDKVFALDPINNKVLWEKSLFGSSSPSAQQQLTVDPRDGSLKIIYQDGWIQYLGQSGPVEASYVCLLTREGLLALDPVTGRTLWTRSDVSPRSRLFGDDQHIYLVEVGDDGTASSGRALRAYDGVSVQVPDFTALYQRRLRQSGRTLLVSETEGKSQALRLYDIATGKDVWKKTFPANSVALRSEVPHLAGMVEPDGKVTVFDLRTQTEVIKTPAWTKDEPYRSVDPVHLEKVQAIHLLQDGVNYYLTFNGPTDPQLNPWGGPWTNLAPQSGMRSISVNGEVYAFKRENGKLSWRANVPSQSLVLEQFHDMPILLFSCRYQRMIQQNRGVDQGNIIESLDKRTGKLVYRTTFPNNGQQFYALNMDPKAGRIDFINYNNQKVVHYIATEDGKGGGVGKDDGKPQGQEPQPQPDEIRRRRIQEVEFERMIQIEKLQQQQQLEQIKRQLELEMIQRKQQLEKK